MLNCNVENKLEELSQRTVAELHRDLEAYLNADVFTYYGSIVNGVERQVKDIIEALANDSSIPRLDESSHHCH